MGAVVDRKWDHTSTGILRIPTLERSTTHEDEDTRQGWWHNLNHNETLVRDSAKGKGLKVKTRVRAGA